MPETASYTPETIVTAYAAQSKATEPRIATADLARMCDDYLLDCEYRQHRPHTIANNRSFLRKFKAFLDTEGKETFGRQEIRLFLHKLQQPESGGRALRPVSARGYHRCLATFFKWLVTEEILPFNPMAKVPPPPMKGRELKQPLSQDAVSAMLRAARNSTSPKRDEALLLMLLDTGCRAAEIVSMKLLDIDIHGRQARIIGKGNKARTVYWGLGTAKALSKYLRHEKREPHDTIFVSDRGLTAGRALTPSGLYQIISSLGKATGVKCGCHDWRRTFAVSLLTDGSNLVAVSRLLGHESLEVTRLYLNLSDYALKEEHRAHSPVDRLRR